MRFNAGSGAVMAAIVVAAVSILISVTQQKPAVVHVAQGRVIAVTRASLVVRSRDQDVTFALNPGTQTVGSIAPGTRVTVHYRDANKLHIATSVQEVKP
jgi:hypothetical protein